MGAEDSKAEDSKAEDSKEAQGGEKKDVNVVGAGLAGFATAAAVFTASGTGYQSGYSLSRAITLAYPATEHLAGAGS